MFMHMVSNVRPIFAILSQSGDGPIPALQSKRSDITHCGHPKFNNATPSSGSLLLMEAQNFIAPIFKWIPDEDDPKTNNKIVLTHIAFKGFQPIIPQAQEPGAQTGSLVSTLITLAIFRRRIRSTPFFRNNLYTTLGMSAGSVGAGYYMLKTSDPVKNYDRAFRFFPFSRRSQLNDG